MCSFIWKKPNMPFHHWFTSLVTTVPAKKEGHFWVFLSCQSEKLLQRSFLTMRWSPTYDVALFLVFLFFFWNNKDEVFSITGYETIRKGKNNTHLKVCNVFSPWKGESLQWILTWVRVVNELCRCIAVIKDLCRWDEHAVQQIQCTFVLSKLRMSTVLLPDPCVLVQPIPSLFCFKISATLIHSPSVGLLCSIYQTSTLWRQWWLRKVLLCALQSARVNNLITHTQTTLIKAYFLLQLLSLTWLIGVGESIPCRIHSCFSLFSVERAPAPIHWGGEKWWICVCHASGGIFIAVLRFRVPSDIDGGWMQVNAALENMF